MTETSSFYHSTLSYLRRPHALPDARKSTGRAVRDALPAALYLALNLWLAVFVTLGLFLLNVPVPTPVAGACLVAAAVPCILGSWAILVRCTEVESGLDI